MSGWFQQITRNLQLPMHYWQFAEDVLLTGPNRQKLDGTELAVEGVVSVRASEAQDSNRKSMILRADVLLRVDQVATVKTTQSLYFRGQFFHIEYVLPATASGYFLVHAVAQRKESTSYSTLNGVR